MIIDIISFWVVVTIAGLGGMALLKILLVILSATPVLGQYLIIDEVYGNKVLAVIFFPLRIVLNLSVFLLPLYFIYLLFTQMVSVSVVTTLDGKLDRQYYYGYATDSLYGAVRIAAKSGFTARVTEELSQMADEQFDALINEVDETATELYGTLLINQSGAPLYHSRIYYYTTNIFEDTVLAMDPAEIKPGSQEEKILKKINRLHAAMKENDVTISDGGHFITEIPHRTYVGCAEKTPENFIFDGNASVANKTINQYLVHLTELPGDSCPTD